MLERGSAAPLCVTFRLSLAEYLQAVQRVALRLPWFWFVVAIIIAAIVGGCAFGLTGSALLASAFLLVGVAYAALLLWVLAIRPRRQYQRIPHLSEDQSYCFSDDELSMTSSSGASHVKWSYFTGFVETREMFLLRHPFRSLFALVPKRAFKTPDDEARFRELARQTQKGARAARPPMI